MKIGAQALVVFRLPSFQYQALRQYVFDVHAALNLGLTALVVFFLSCLIGFEATGQFIAPSWPSSNRKRLEINGAPSELIIEVQPIPADSGFLVYTNHLDRHQGDAEKHSFSTYNHRLERRWTTNVHLPAGTECRALTVDGAVPYALCTTTDAPRTLLILRFAPASGETQLYHYQLPALIQPLAFEVSGPEAFVVAMAYRQQTVLRLPLLDSAAVQFLPTLSGPTTSIADAVPEPGGLTVLTAERLDATTRLLLRPFRTATHLPTELQVLQSPMPANLTTGRIAAIPSIAIPRFLVGTYSTRDPRYAQGFFSTRLSPTTGGEGSMPTQLYYYDLPTLPHYYDRFRPRRRARAMARAKRRRAAGLETTAHARLLLHRPLPLPNGGYVVVAEQYYPRYRSGDSWGYRRLGTGFYPGMNGFAYGLPGLYGNYDPVNVWDRGLDGYVFTQALVCAFDSTGRLRWQNSFVLGNLTRPDLNEQVVATVLPSGGVALVAISDNYERLHQVTITGSNTPAAPRETKLLPAIPDTERLLDVRTAQVLAWHTGHALCVGFQRIRPQGKREREVFVIEDVTW
jgi:hypothetical protein